MKIQNISAFSLSPTYLRLSHKFVLCHIYAVIYNCILYIFEEKWILFIEPTHIQNTK